MARPSLCRIGSGVHAELFRQGDADRLALLGVLQFNLGNAEQQAGNQISDGAAEVYLLSDGYHADTALALIGQHINALLEVSGPAGRASTPQRCRSGRRRWRPAISEKRLAVTSSRSRDPQTTALF